MGLKKGGPVFWFWLQCTIAMMLLLLVLLGCSQILVVEGLECDICVRFSDFNLALNSSTYMGNQTTNGPCKRMQCDSFQNVTTMRNLVRNELSKMEAELQEELYKELLQQLAALIGGGMPDRRNSEDEINDAKEWMPPLEKRFVCTKGLLRWSWKKEQSDLALLGDKMQTIGICGPYSPSRPPRTEPYEIHDAWPGKRVVKAVKNQLWYFCNVENENGCRIDKKSDEQLLPSNTSDTTSKAATTASLRLSFLHSTWILILILSHSS